jgi:signal transduction histidine kinase
VSVRTSPTIAEGPAPHPADKPPAWLDGLGDGCLLLDPDLTVLYANAPFAQSVGRPATAMIGRPLPALLGDCSDSPLCRIALSALRENIQQEADVPEGDRWFHLRARPVPEGVVVTRTDVTARRQLEAKLLQNALHCRLVLEQLPTVHWSVDKELRPTHSFGAELAAIGLSDEQNRGLTFVGFLETDDPDSLTVRMHRRALAGERIRYSHTSGGRRFDVCLEPLRQPGGVIIGVLGLAHDVTGRHDAAEERARLQETLLLAQKRESLSLLATSLSHAFNNLLSAIAGSASLLLRELPPGPTHESAALIKKAADRAADVTRQMLVFAGKTVLSRRPLDLNELVRENLPALSAAVTGSVTLKTSLAETLPAVLADPGLLQQAVMNLVLNARDATADHGGAVTIATGRSDQLRVPGVYLDVSDDGCGMTDAVRARAFDPFFTTKGRGRGLGLSSVQGIVRSHGGDVLVQSDPGRGSTFRILLPAGDPHVPPAVRGSP